MPKVIRLVWKKRRDGSLVARERGVIYTITPRSHKTVPITYYQLKKDDLRICEFPFNKGKQSCKNVANEVASKSLPIYRRVMVGILNKRLKAKFEWEMKEVFQLNELPKMKGDFDKYFRKQAEKGISPHNAAKQLDELPEEYLASLQVELWPIYYPIWLKNKRKEEYERETALVAAIVKPPEPLIKTPGQDAPIIHEQYHGPSPEVRDSSLKAMLSVPTQSNPCPFKPQDAKFSTLFKWAEKVRDYFEARGKFAPVRYLRYALTFCCNWDGDRCIKACRRVDAIYPDEAQKEHEYFKYLVANAGKTATDPENKTKPKRKGKDKWGFREGTRSAKVNAVITKEVKSLRQIERDSGCTSVSSHLSALVRRKLVKRVDGKFRLWKHKKGKS